MVAGKVSQYGLINCQESAHLIPKKYCPPAVPVYTDPGGLLFLHLSSFQLFRIFGFENWGEFELSHLSSTTAHQSLLCIFTQVYAYL